MSGTNGGVLAVLTPAERGAADAALIESTVAKNTAPRKRSIDLFSQESMERTARADPCERVVGSIE
jgi:hypothetical protein